MKNISTEDYLRVIYTLSEKNEDGITGVRSVDVARELDISKPSVSAMLRKLAAQGYLDIQPYSRIEFTENGIQEARRITHNFRVIEVFLREILGYELEDIHEEAHRLEHAFSETSIERLDNFLKNPVRCPHGEEIPHED